MTLTRGRFRVPTAHQNAVLLTVSALLGRAGGIVLLPAIARTTSPSALGAYQIANTLVTYGFLLLLFGLGPLVVRAMVANPGQQAVLYWEVIYFRAVLGTGAVALPLVAAVAVGYGRRVYILLAVLSIGMLANAVVDTTNIVFQANRRLKYALYASIINVAVYVVGGLGALAGGLGVVGVALANTGSSLLQAGASALMVRRRFLRLPTPRPKVAPVPMLRNAFPFFAATTSSYLINRVDVLLVSVFLSLSQVGIYAAGYLLFDVAMIVPNAIGQAIYPDLAASAEEGHSELRRVINGYMTRTAGGLAVLTTVLWVGAPRIVSGLYGGGYGESATVVRLVILSLVLTAVTTTIGRGLFAAGGQSEVARTAGIAAGFNILVNVMAIPLAGLNGAAAVTTLTYVVSAALHWFFARRRGFGPAPTALLGPLAAMSIGILAGLAIGSHHAAGGAVLAGLTTGALVAAAGALPHLLRRFR